MSIIITTSFMEFPSCLSLEEIQSLIYIAHCAIQQSIYFHNCENYKQFLKLASARMGYVHMLFGSLAKRMKRLILP